MTEQEKYTIAELREILDCLAENTTDSNQRMAESGISLIDELLKGDTNE